MCEIGWKLVLFTDIKSYKDFRLASILVILNCLQLPLPPTRTISAVTRFVVTYGVGYVAKRY